jgi:hypothetical protein
VPANCLSRGLAEMFVLLLVVIVVVNAFALMARILSFGEALRNVVVATCLLLAIAALPGILLHLWEDLSILEKIGGAVIATLLVLRRVPQRGHAPRRGKAEQ